MKTFKDKVAVVTGAGSGMGRYLSVLLAKDGADVVVCDVNQETLNETVEMLRNHPKDYPKKHRHNWERNKTHNCYSKILLIPTKVRE